MARREQGEYQALLPAQGRLFVVSGPSGVGKDSVLTALFASSACPPGLLRCVTATTRAPRPGEMPGRDYFFLTRSEFEGRIAQGFFLEHAVYNGDRYGTPGGYVAQQRAQGHDVLLKIEVQGALQVRAAVPDAILIFLAPPCWKELERRLRSRATDDPAEVARRLAIAQEEMQAAPRYDYLVVNAKVEEAADALRAIVIAERCRIAKEGARHSVSCVGNDAPSA